MTSDAAGRHDDVLCALGERPGLRVGNRIELGSICRRDFGSAEPFGCHQGKRRNQVQECQKPDRGEHEQYAECPLDDATNVHSPPADPALPGYATSGMSFFRISSWNLPHKYETMFGRAGAGILVEIGGIVRR